MIVTLILTICIIVSSFDPNVDQKKGWLAFVHILTEIVVIFNAITVLVYWTVIHKDALEAYADS